MDTLLDFSLIAKLLASAFLAVLFLQSGFDKIFDWSGNLSWLTGHFAKSPLKNMVPILLGIITAAEVLAGLLSAAGLIALLLSGSSDFALYGAELSALSLLMLFFGQRIAKDYEGAASLVNYFILTILAILLHGGMWG